MTIRRLVRNALRMRPDRIVVGEVRGAEALDMLSAMITGHDGSLSTVHADSAAEALRRVETLALMAGLGLPHAAVREQVAERSTSSSTRRGCATARGGSSPSPRSCGSQAGSASRALRARRRGARLARSARRLPSPHGSPTRQRGMSPVALVAGLAGACALLAAWEVVSAADEPRAVRALRAWLAPAWVVRSGARTDEPGERRRLVLLGAMSLLAPGWLLAGPGSRSRSAPPLRRRPAPSCARAAAPARRRWRPARRRSPARSPTRSPAGTRCAARSAGRARRRRQRPRRGASCAPPRPRWSSASGPRTSCSRSRADAGRAIRRIDTLVAAVLLQRDAGGDLAGLLRELAVSLEERARVDADARAATAQARFTALLVGALPVAGRPRRARQPGFRRGLASSPLTAWLVGWRSCSRRRVARDPPNRRPGRGAVSAAAARGRRVALRASRAAGVL